MVSNRPLKPLVSLLSNYFIRFGRKSTEHLLVSRRVPKLIDFSRVCVRQFRSFYILLTSRRAVTGIGGTTLLSMSLLGRKTDESDKKKQEEERKKQAIIKKADELYDNYLIDHVYNGLIRFAKSDDADYLWRLARATCERAKLSRDKKERQNLMYEAFEYIQRAMEFQPKEGLFAVHKWYAILRDYTAEYEGTKKRLTCSPEIREHLEKALQINPKDATTWHILGLWHFTFADLPGYQRQLASLIFAKPPQSTYQEALDHFLKAEHTEPSFYNKNLCMIGKTYLRMGDKKKAVEFLEKAYNMVVVSVDDSEAHTEAYKLLKKLGVDKHKEAESQEEEKE